MSVTTNTGGNRLFNGCWVTIDIPLPTNYTAPHAGRRDPRRRLVEDRVRHGRQLDRQRHECTTWTVSLLGNPVHLVIP